MSGRDTAERLSYSTNKLTWRQQAFTAHLASGEQSDCLLNTIGVLVPYDTNAGPETTQIHSHVPIVTLLFPNEVGYNVEINMKNNVSLNELHVCNL